MISIGDSVQRITKTRMMAWLLLAVSLSLALSFQPLQAQGQQHTPMPVPPGSTLRATVDGKVAEVKVGDVPQPVAFPFSSVTTTTDPMTGITTTTGKRPDGSEVITRVDREGNELSTKIKPPPGEGPHIVSTTDPKTGITTTVTTELDGTRTVTKTETRQDPNGTQHITTTDDKGGRSETVVKPDGTITTNRTTADGGTVGSTKEPDGTITMVENHAGGGETTTTRDAQGQITTEKFDAKGNKAESVTRLADGSQTRTDEQGNVTKTSAPDADGRVTVTTTDHRGNTRTVTRDAKGDVVAQEERQATPKEPGQQYYENVIGGTSDWESLPGSMKTGFAGSERQMRDADAMQKLRTSQDEQRAREDAAREKSYAERQAKTDEKLAAIQAEQDAADRKSAERVARETRQNQLEESYEKAAKLQADYDAAVKRGDMTEARRIMKQQDAHHDASAALMELNDEEKQAMERRQTLRDEIANKLFGSAREEALRKDEHDAAQSLKEGVTDVTKWGLNGSEMQQLTKESTRQANRQLSEAEYIRAGLAKMLKDPKTSPAERAIATDMLKLCEAKERGAYEQLSSNANLTRAGYAIDAASLVAGGPISKLATKALGAVGQKTVGQLGLAATRRVAGEKAAQTLASRSAAVADKARAAANYVADSKVGQALSSDVGKLARGQVAQAESKWLKGVVEETVEDAVVGAGAEAAITGDIDPESLIKGAVAGAIFTPRLGGGLKTGGAPDAKAPPPGSRTAGLVDTVSSSADAGKVDAASAPQSKTMTSSHTGASAPKPAQPPAQTTTAAKTQPEIPTGGNQTAQARPPSEPAPLVKTAPESGQTAATAGGTKTAPAAIEGPAARPQTDAPPPPKPAVQPKNQPVVAKEDVPTAQPPSAKPPTRDGGKAVAKLEPPQTQKPPVSEPVRSGDADMRNPPEVDDTGMGRLGARSKTPDGPAADTSSRNAPGPPRRYDPEASTDHGASARNSGATPERNRNSLKTPEAQKRFDQTMDVIDRLKKENPSLAKLDPERVAAIQEAHLVGAGELGKDGVWPAEIGNYTMAQLLKKRRILYEAGFNSREIRELMENGVVGARPSPKNPMLPQQIDRGRAFIGSDPRPTLLDSLDKTRDPELSESVNGYFRWLKGRIDDYRRAAGVTNKSKADEKVLDQLEQEAVAKFSPADREAWTRFKEFVGRPGQVTEPGNRAGKILEHSSTANKAEGTKTRVQYRVGDTINRQTDVEGEVGDGVEHMIEVVPEKHRAHMVPPQHGVNDPAGLYPAAEWINLTVDGYYEKGIKRAYEVLTRSGTNGSELLVTVTVTRLPDRSVKKVWNLALKHRNEAAKPVGGELGYMVDAAQKTITVLDKGVPLKVGEKWPWKGDKDLISEMRSSF